MAYYLGVDLGLTGAIAVLSTSVGVEPTVRDMPTIPYQTSAGRNRRRYNVSAILRLIEPFANGIELACMEEVHAMPHGTSASFSLGMGSGLFEMAFAALEIRHRRVRPIDWKRHFKLTGLRKGNSRVVAAQLFPAVVLGSRSDEGRAEALLLAEYAKVLS